MAAVASQQNKNACSVENRGETPARQGLVGAISSSQGFDVLVACVAQVLLSRSVCFMLSAMWIDAVV